MTRVGSQGTAGIKKVTRVGLEWRRVGYRRTVVCSAGTLVGPFISLKSLEEKLPADRFMRVHRSFILKHDKTITIARSRIVLGKT
jgi:hypothetical protein